jgi:hypothetical protein
VRQPLNPVNPVNPVYFCKVLAFLARFVSNADPVHRIVPLTILTLPGFVLNKSETPFASLFWGFYEQIKPADR